MNLFQAAVLGFVQGATEWLPVSSTAHLRVVPALLGWADPGAAFTAVIQWGTLLAALVYFRRDIKAILTGHSDGFAFGQESAADRRLLLPILIGTLPVVVVGLLLKHRIEHEWRSMYVVAGSMIGFGILLWLVELLHRARREMGSVSLSDGVMVGIGQAFALIPGASRSGTTITAALAIGLERSTAARFSFLLSLPAVFLAGAKELFDARHDLLGSQLGGVLVATAVAFVVGYASIDWLMKFLRKYPTYVFVVYRLVLGIVLLVLTYKGIVPAMPPAEKTALAPAAHVARVAQANPGQAR